MVDPDDCMDLISVRYCDVTAMCIAFSSKFLFEKACFTIPPFLERSLRPESTKVAP